VNKEVKVQTSYWTCSHDIIITTYHRFAKLEKRKENKKWNQRFNMTLDLSIVEPRRRNSKLLLKYY
jgi:hypothetical protein